MTVFFGRELREGEHLFPIFPSEVGRAAESLNVGVWTKRLALAPAPASELPRMAELMNDLVEKSVDFVAIPVGASGPSDIGEILEALSGTENLFISISGGLDELMLFASLLKGAFSNLGSEACTRISFTLGEPLLTPYFPSASAVSGEVGVSASMLYADDVRNALASGIGADGAMRRSYARAYELLRTVSTRLNIENYGVDLSLSPWMDESVARLVEAVSGVEFGGPGSHDAVHKLSRAMDSVASSKGVEAVGFNEVMLPYAEDSRLLELGAQGKLTAYSLLSFAPICVAGLDMVVIPYHGEGELMRFLKDVYAVLSSKGRPSGIRVVLAQGEPRDIIELRHFGRVAVMGLR